MKRLLVIAAALFVIILPSLSIAAPSDSTAVSGGRPNSLRDGAWAAQFSFNGSLSTAGVFVKRHRAPNHALRFGFELSLDSRSGEVATDTTDVQITTLHSNRSAITLLS